MDEINIARLVRDGRLASIAISSSVSAKAGGAEIADALAAALDDFEDGAQSDVLIVRLSGRAGETAVRLSCDNIEGCRKLEKLMLRIESLRCVTLAIVEGSCEGVWLQLALACDLRIATSDSAIRISELKRGLLPSLSAFRLARYVGLGVARRLLLTGQPLSAADCSASGVFDVVCAREQLEAAIKAHIQQLEPIHAGAVVLARRLLNESLSSQPDQLLGPYIAAQQRCLQLLRQVGAEEPCHV